MQLVNTSLVEQGKIICQLMHDAITFDLYQATRLTEEDHPTPGVLDPWHKLRNVCRAQHV
jgi:hypothetical protein